MTLFKPNRPVIGAIYGKWTVVGVARPNKYKQTLALARCECGAERTLVFSQLLHGYTKSCGSCAATIRQTRHGQAMNGRRSYLYTAWSHFKYRCHNPASPEYRNYGGRGIVVCREWRTDFQAFAESIGARPSKWHSVDRINNDGNYEPGNVQWATRQEQSENKRSSVFFRTLDDQRMTLTSVANYLAISASSLSYNFRRLGVLPSSH